jgi:hypothetical protein
MRLLRRERAESTAANPKAARAAGKERDQRDYGHSSPSRRDGHAPSPNAGAAAGRWVRSAYCPDHCRRRRVAGEFDGGCGCRSLGPRHPSAGGVCVCTAGPLGGVGQAVCQRRLTRAITNARRALEPPCILANDAEVEILGGSPSRRIAELAAARGAQLVVVGSRRGRLRRSVSHRLIAASNVDRPSVESLRPPFERGVITPALPNHRHPFPDAPGVDRRNQVCVWESAKVRHLRIRGAHVSPGTALGTRDQ